MPSWKPPTQDMVKLNFDGASFLSSGSAGIGAILRDEKGDVLLL